MDHPRQILERFDHQPKQSLGQNFLWDENILDRIIQAAQVNVDATVLEIGPGLGHLTERLAQQVNQVVAVELDNRFLPILDERLANYNNVQVIHGDILDQDLGELFPHRPVPHHRQCPLLHHRRHPPPSHGSQPSPRDSRPHRPKRGRSTDERCSWKHEPNGRQRATLWRCGFCRSHQSGQLLPRPDVDSAIVRIDLSKGPAIPLANDKRFMQIVKAGFAQKKKNATQEST